MKNPLLSNLEMAIHTRHEQSLLTHFSFNTSYNNELLFFLKPECFFNNQDSSLLYSIISMVLNKMEDYKVLISGALLVSGRFLAKNRIMDRHYGYTNTLSRKASHIVGTDEISSMKTLLTMAETQSIAVLGGHEFLEKFKNYNPSTLNTLWETKKSIKLKSGFYFQKYEIDEQEVILVNAFHPEQLVYYTKPSHFMLILLLHSNTQWNILRAQFLGNTFPEKAEPNSLRSEFYHNKEQYGLKEVSAAYNCAHLSAGPFEALFEINNFLLHVDAIDYDISKTNLCRLMALSKIYKPDRLDYMNNPLLSINDQQVTLYEYTEDFDTKQAINAYKQFKLNR